MAKFYCCRVTLYASDVMPENFEIKAKVKKGKMFFLNKVADTIRLFINEVGAKPNRTWTFDYQGDLKEEFMIELNKESKKNPAAPSGGRTTWL